MSSVEAATFARVAARHQYGFRLKWELVRELAREAVALHPELRVELNTFLEFLDGVADSS